MSSRDALREYRELLEVNLRFWRAASISEGVVWGEAAQAALSKIEEGEWPELTELGGFVWLMPGLLDLDESRALLSVIKACRPWSAVAEASAIIDDEFARDSGLEAPEPLELYKLVLTVAAEAFESNKEHLQTYQIVRCAQIGTEVLEQGQWPLPYFLGSVLWYTLFQPDKVAEAVLALVEEALSNGSDGDDDSGGDDDPDNGGSGDPADEIGETEPSRRETTRPR